MKKLKTASLKINLRWQVVNWQPQWKKIWLIFFYFFSIIYYFVHCFFKKRLRCMARWAKPFYQGGTVLPRCLIISPRSDMYLNASLTIYHLHLTDVMYNWWMSCGFLYLIKNGPPIRFVRYSQKVKAKDQKRTVFQFHPFRPSKPRGLKGYGWGFNSISIYFILKERLKLLNIITSEKMHHIYNIITNNVPFSF